MRRLKERPRADALTNEVRGNNFAWTRIIYFGVLLLGAVWTTDLFFGSYFYLKSEGMVVARSATLATEFPATIRSIDVLEGERVGKGQLIATISSQQINESIARLTNELATLRAREGELRIQAQRNASLLELAKYRSSIASETREKYEILQRKGILPSDKRVAAIESDYRGQHEVETLSSEISAISEEMNKISPAVGRAELALQQLENLYGAGAILSPIDGVVGRRHVDTGSVVRPGEPIADIYSNKIYVLAYLPTGTLFDVEPGANVTVSWGVKKIIGQITAVDNIATQLPKEFQTAFSPVARNQILRIELPQSDDGVTPPLFTKVKIRSEGPIDSLLEHFR